MLISIVLFTSGCSQRGPENASNAGENKKAEIKENLTNRTQVMKENITNKTEAKKEEIKENLTNRTQAMKENLTNSS
jgi:hypothetical protein